MTATGLTAFLIDLTAGRITGTPDEIAQRYGISPDHVRGYLGMGRGW